MIKVLEKTIADKIAAGEVIERPVSIIKELIENSIDAKSTSITIEIQNGGKSYIRVTDNGCGIPMDEVETAFLRHATSKISKVDDLDGIFTLGFRGEALASIAAVTRTEIITKTSEQKTAKRLEIHGGEVISNTEIGSETGTTIICRDLFYNTPARLKFLKQDNIESTKIIELLSEIALCYKDIKFRFINNHNVVFSTNGDGNRLGIIMRVYNDININNLVPINYSKDGLSLTGYISNPQMSKNSSKSQIFFVNGRVINSKVFEKGINIGYKERLFEGRFPICFLFLDVDPKILDVNIHPNKKEVRFDDENMVSTFIGEAINSSLVTKQAIPDMGNLFKSKESIEKKEKQEQVDIKTLLSIDSRVESEFNENVIERPIRNDIRIENIDNFINNNDGLQKIGNIDHIFNEKSIEIDKPSLKSFDFNDINIIGIIFDTYIEAIDSNSFYLIDQHAAQERIFYEKLVSQYDSKIKDRQSLIIPILINVSLSSNSEKLNWLSELDRMGFTISEFGNGSYRITEIPMFMEISEAENFVNSFIENIGTSIDLRNTVIVNKLIMMSCKASIKANDRITLEEAKALINDLKNCVNPYSCPHGRPTVIKFTKYEIEKMFKRV